MVVTSGVPLLDDALDGGFPEQSTIVLTGGPGTGKSTFAMQYLDRGLKEGDRCLFISTEETIPELRRALQGYEFDLESENMFLTTLRASPGKSWDSADEKLVLRTIEDGSETEREVSAPLNSQNLMEFVRRYAPLDRIVFDSVSALGAIVDSPTLFRQLVLDLMHTCNNAFEATTLMTADGVAAGVGLNNSQVTSGIRPAVQTAVNRLNRSAIFSDRLSQGSNSV